MKDIFELQSRMMDTWMAQAASAGHAWTTIALRMPVLANLAVSPGGKGRAEADRMVREKMDAAFEGFLAGTTAAIAAGMKAAATSLSAPAMASAALGIFQAAAEPAQARVRANARRLTR